MHSANCAIVQFAQTPSSGYWPKDTNVLVNLFRQRWLKGQAGKVSITDINFFGLLV